MISFEKYFEGKVEDIIKQNDGQIFYVFRGFGIQQLEYLMYLNNFEVK